MFWMMMRTFEVMVGMDLLTKSFHSTELEFTMNGLLLGFSSVFGLYRFSTPLFSN